MATPKRSWLGKLLLNGKLADEAEAARLKRVTSSDAAELNSLVARLRRLMPKPAKTARPSG